MNEKQTETTSTPENHDNEPSHGEISPPQEGEKEPSPEVKRQRIKTLNDVFRQTFLGGRVVMTQGINQLPQADQQELITQVREFKDFSEENDPHGEHDFGIIKHKGKSVYWKIDSYDKSLEYGSPDVSDPSVTERVLTILYASEY